MVSASEVQSLNSRIEEINVQRTKGEARLEMLKKQLETELSSYEEQFGVTLKGAKFNTTKARIEKELKQVVAEVEAEYELKQKVVQAIDEGDYEGACELLGIEEEASEDEIVVEEPKVAKKSKVVTPVIEEEDEDEEDFSINPPTVKAAEAEEDEELVVMDDDGDEEEEEKVVVPKKAQSSKSATSIKGTPAISLVDEMEVVDDDDDVIPDLSDSDFGFGSMLQGTKFKAD